MPEDTTPETTEDETTESSRLVETVVFCTVAAVAIFGGVALVKKIRARRATTEVETTPVVEGTVVD